MALALVLIAAGTTLYVAIGHRSSSNSAAIDGNLIDIGKAPETGDEELGPSQNARLTFMDKKDATRIFAELAYETLDPVGRGQYKLAQPRAWLYFRDGRILHIQAATGKVRMPPRAQQPESGEFTGGVTVRLFAPGTAPPGKPIDPEKDTPTLMAFTPSLTFDTNVLELQTDHPITVSTPAMQFDGQGLIVRGNEVRERIEVLKTSGRTFRFNPAAPVRKPGPVAATPPPPPTTAPAPTTPTAPAPTVVAQAPTPRETLYRVLISDDVTLTQTTRTLAADTLELFARVLDNKLPDDALAPLAFAITRKEADPNFIGPLPESAPKAVAAKSASDVKPAPDLAPKPAATDSAAPAPAHAIVAATTPDAALTPPTLFVSAGNEDIVLNWSGPLVMTPVPLDPVPALLKDKNHLAARFSAEKPGGRSYVTLSDTATKAAAVCAAIEYAATSRDLSILNGPGVDNVSVYAPDLGRAVFPAAKANLGTGLAQVRGGGLLASFKASSEPAAAVASTSPAQPVSDESRVGPLDAALLRQITWNDQADFALRTINGKVAGALSSASFTGGVLARDRGSTIGGEYLRAEFAEAVTPAASLRRLHLSGNVVGVAGASAPDPARPQPAFDPFLRADELDVSFQPNASGTEADPTFAIAKGKARAASKEAEVRAGKLEARLGKDSSGNVGVLEVIATDTPQFERADGVFASADVIRADMTKRTADMTANPKGEVIVGRQNSRILCTRIRMDELAGTSIVTGPGRFEHVQFDGPVDPATAALSVPIDDAHSTKVVATWAKGMIFNNTLGTIDCDGDATFSATAPLSIQKATADQIRINITPGSSSVAPRSNSSDSAMALTSAGSGDLLAGDRRVQRAEAIGTAANDPDGKNAKLESYRYAPPTSPGGQRIREQVFYIEGPKVVYDDVAGTFTVPGGGLAIMRDERIAGAQEQANSVTPFTGSARGTARLSWAGSMLHNLRTGAMSATKDVELAHVPPGAAKPTRVVATALTAQFGTGSGQGQGSDLLSAEAHGAVYAETGPKDQQQKLFADHFRYGATDGIAEAWAEDGNRVTLYDDRRPTPVVARRLKWNLINERVEITEPAPVIAPR